MLTCAGSRRSHLECIECCGSAQDTLFEPAQSKCMWTFHKSHFTREFTGKMPQAKAAGHTLCEPAQSKRTWTLQKSHFVREFTCKMPQTKSATHTFCGPAQLKCTWTFHKSHFVRKFTGKPARAPWSSAGLYAYPIRTPQCGHDVWETLRLKKKGKLRNFSKKFRAREIIVSLWSNAQCHVIGCHHRHGLLQIYRY